MWLSLWGSGELSLSLVFSLFVLCMLQVQVVTVDFLYYNRTSDSLRTLAVMLLPTPLDLLWVVTHGNILTISCSVEVLVFTNQA